MKFDQNVCTDLSQARRKEWLETNGIGGFASSTMAGMNTRRYHGLLVAATRPPVGRTVLLSKIEERLRVGDAIYDLSTNQYPGAIHPNGYGYLSEFRLDPMPTFVYRAGNVLLEKTVFMIQGENSTALRYRLLNNPETDVRLELLPLIAFRDYHSLTHANPSLNREVQTGPAWCAVRPYEGLPNLFLNHDGGAAQSGGDWYHNFEYEEERARGLDYHEDLYNPFALWFNLRERAACLIASTEVRDAGSFEKVREAEVRRRQDLVQGWEASDGFVRDLLLAADQFIVRRGEDRKTVIAGYPWFTDWGRDTMIALPGLALIPRRFDEAKRILCAFAEHCDRGMLPNRFPDAGEPPEYNTVDATLWFFQAIYALVTKTGDYAFVRQRLFDTLVDILRWHLSGTRYNIKADRDGLLRSGEPGVQLTWMDAKVGDWVVTPRRGKAVEIQALWYNALRILEHLAGKYQDLETEQLCADLASKACASFNGLFWNSQAGCLYDCIENGRPDAAIRPNQIFAVSLPFSMLPVERMKQVVETVTRDLLTPFGLRSLSPKDPGYRGFYGGDPRRRDGAYHQGTVWAWLMGPYVTARVRANGGTSEARREAAALLTGLRDHLKDAGLGTISEIFDGDPPHAPKGCIAQAWSVAEVLRCIVEDEISDERKLT